MLAVLALAGCTTYQQGVEREGRAYIDKYDWHKTALQQAIKEHRLMAGMTRDEVVASRGEPISRDNTEIGRYIYEEWVYEKRYNGRLTGASLLFFRDGLLSFWRE